MYGRDSRAPKRWKSGKVEKWKSETMLIDAVLCTLHNVLSKDISTKSKRVKEQKRKR